MARTYLSLTIDKKLKARLEKLAKREQRSLNFVAVRSITKGLGRTRK